MSRKKTNMMQFFHMTPALAERLSSWGDFVGIGAAFITGVSLVATLMGRGYLDAQRDLVTAKSQNEILKTQLAVSWRSLNREQHDALVLFSKKNNTSVIFHINNGDSESLYYAKSMASAFVGEKQSVLPVYNFAPIDIPAFGIKCYDDKVAQEFAAEFRRIGIPAEAVPTNGTPQKIEGMITSSMPAEADRWVQIYVPSKSPPSFD